MKHPVILLSIVMLSACGLTKTPSVHPAYAQTRSNSENIKESLFDSQQRTISEEDIKRLLDGKIEIPDSARVAIYNFGTSSLNKYYASYNYNEEFLKLRQNYIEKLTSTIHGSDRIQKVTLMPSIMTTQNPTLTNLRESAVRLQADLLVIFSIKSDVYYRYKAFKKDQAKAFATIETILLDIRTGVVPFSSIVTKEQLIQKKESDLDIRETQRRAESEAVMSALTESGNQLVNFLF